MDYVKLWGGAYLFMICQYFGGVILLVAITRNLQRWGFTRRIQKNWPPLRQYIIETFVALRSLAVNSWCYLIVTHGMFNGWFPVVPHGDINDAWWQITIDAIIMFVAHDAYFYWTHRIMHHKWLFKPFHLEHHLARTPTPLTSMRMTVLEAFVQSGFFVLWAWFMPDSQISFAIVLSYIIFIGSLGHSGYEWSLFNFTKYRFSRQFTTVLHHDMHHLGGYNSNYAIHFTWWDRLMGTDSPLYEGKITAFLENYKERRKAAKEARRAAMAAPVGAE